MKHPSIGIVTSSQPNDGCDERPLTCEQDNRTQSNLCDKRKQTYCEMASKQLKRKAVKAFMSPMRDDDDDYSSDEENSMQQLDTDDDGGDYEPQPQYQRNGKRLQSSLGSSDDLFHNVTAKIQRMPTRRPNPKISNRNALMARENRRKKKEHLESLQKNVDDAQNENKKLKKMLRIRNQTIAKMTQESLYLRSILANKTEIMSLLKTIQGNRTPITSSTLSFVADDDANYQCNEITSNKRINSYTSSGGVSPLSSLSSHSMDGTEKENGTRAAPPSTDPDPFLSSITQQYSLFTDLDSVADDPFGIESASPSTPFGANGDDDFQWEHLLSDPSGFNCKSVGHTDDIMSNIADLRDIDDSEILSTHSNNNVNNEHNYFNNPIAPKVAADVGASASTKPGICLHISSGRVSLEFCAQCHINSQNAWIEEM